MKYSQLVHLILMIRLGLGLLSIRAPVHQSRSRVRTSISPFHLLYSLTLGFNFTRRDMYNFSIFHFASLHFSQHHLLFADIFLVLFTSLSFFSLSSISHFNFTRQDFSSLYPRLTHFALPVT